VNVPVFHGPDDNMPPGASSADPSFYDDDAPCVNCEHPAHPGLPCGALYEIDSEAPGIPIHAVMLECDCTDYEPYNEEDGYGY
jgi:hypothetical protein